MQKLEITGGKKISGVIKISGSKNDTLPILDESILTNKILFAILFSFLICNCSTDRDKQLNSSEYKLLLSADKFDNPLIGFKNYWEIVKKVAKNHNITVVEKTNPFTLKHKEVSFFDTEQRELRKAGFLIRQKVKYEKAYQKEREEYIVKFSEYKKSLETTPST